MRVVIALVLAAGCSDPTGGSVEGRALYGKLCAQCHGATGKPTAAMVQSVGVRDLSDPSVRAKLTEARVADQIRKGSANKLMPAFTGLVTEPQIEALAAFVLSPAFLAQEAPPPVPAPVPTPK